MEHNVAYSLAVFLISVLLTFFVMTSALKRSARHLICLELVSVVIFCSILAWLQGRYFSAKLSFLEDRAWADAFIISAEAFTASLCAHWLFLRKSWGQQSDKNVIASEAKRSTSSEIASGASHPRNDVSSKTLVWKCALLSVFAALALWGGSFDVEVWAWVEKLFLLVTLLFVAPPLLLSLDRRLSILPVPKIFKGPPILLISSGLLALGLLGLSGLF